MAKAKNTAGVGLSVAKVLKTKRTKRPSAGPNRPRRKAYRGQGRP